MKREQLIKVKTIFIFPSRVSLLWISSAVTHSPPTLTVLAILDLDSNRLPVGQSVCPPHSRCFLISVCYPTISLVKFDT